MFSKFLITDYYQIKFITKRKEARLVAACCSPLNLYPHFPTHSSKYKDQGKETERSRHRPGQGALHSGFHSARGSRALAPGKGSSCLAAAESHFLCQSRSTCRWPSGTHLGGVLCHSTLTFLLSLASQTLQAVYGKRFWAALPPTWMERTSLNTECGENGMCAGDSLTCPQQLPSGAGPTLNAVSTDNSHRPGFLRWAKLCFHDLCVDVPTSVVTTVGHGTMSSK